MNNGKKTTFCRVLSIEAKDLETGNTMKGYEFELDEVKYSVFPTESGQLSELIVMDPK